MDLGRSGGSRLVKFIPLPPALSVMWSRSRKYEVLLDVQQFILVPLLVAHLRTRFLSPNGSFTSFVSSIQANRKQLVILAFIAECRGKLSVVDFLLPRSTTRYSCSHLNSGSERKETLQRIKHGKKCLTNTHFQGCSNYHGGFSCVEDVVCYFSLYSCQRLNSDEMSLYFSLLSLSLSLSFPLSLSLSLSCYLQTDRIL